MSIVRQTAALALIVFASITLIPTAHAADAKGAGTWTISGDVQGVAVHDVCVLTGTDDKLTGTCTMEGKARDTVGSFVDKKLLLKHPGEYQGDPLTILYLGKVQEDGTVAGDIDVEPMGYTGSFTATHQK